MAKGKVAIITGASSGMGREFALQIAQGYRSVEEIWLIARRKERLREVERQLLGRKIRILILDLIKENDLEELKRVLEKEKPSVRVLVNAAGYGMIGEVRSLGLKDNVGMVDLNCRALTAVTYMVLPYLCENSKVIQLASSAAFLPQPRFAVYAASKSYVLSFSRALAREVEGMGITVTAVCPGPVKTEFFDIAETYESVRLYKKLTMAKPGKVVRRALLDAKHGRKVSVYGLPMKLFRVLCKLLPAEWLLRFVK